MKPVSADITEGCRRGERRAQAELYAIVHGLMTGMCRRYYSNKEDCSSIANESFLKLLNSLQTKPPEASLEAWCRKITMNTIIDDFRKNRKRKETITSMKENATTDISQAAFNLAETSFAAEEMEELLLSLPEATRYVFNLFAIEGYAHAEISAMMDIAEGTSKWHVSEARRLLKLSLEKRMHRNA